MNTSNKPTPKLHHVWRACLLAMACSATQANAIPINDEWDVGGALRVNYGWKDYDSDDSIEFELFRVDVNYQSDVLYGSAQYRWYKDIDVIHHAYIGYHINEQNKIQMGVTQVPFGILPYNSHSFWFSANYYLGFEDDYDTGFHWINETGSWRWDLAYFISDEYADGTEFDRYSFDIATTADSAYEEAGQVNLRGENTIKSGEFSHKVGASLQWQQLEYQGDTAGAGPGDDIEGYAGAVHWQMDWQQWQTQLQYMHYYYDTPSDKRVALSAFAFPFEIANEADVITANIAKGFDVDWGPITHLNCYNDYSQIFASGQGRADSIQNVTGCAITAGKFYSYVDWIAGNNMWFINGPGIGIDEGEQRWSSRLNVNIGFYF